VVKVLADLSEWLWSVERVCGLDWSAIPEKNRGPAHWQRGNAVGILYEVIMPKLSGQYANHRLILTACGAQPGLAALH
jgi:hypothetical protein